MTVAPSTSGGASADSPGSGCRASTRPLRRSSTVSTRAASATYTRPADTTGGPGRGTAVRQRASPGGGLNATTSPTVEVEAAATQVPSGAVATGENTARPVPAAGSTQLSS